MTMVSLIKLMLLAIIVIGVFFVIFWGLTDKDSYSGVGSIVTVVAIIFYLVFVVISRT